jgi:hypothetical protein
MTSKRLICKIVIKYYYIYIYIYIYINLLDRDLIASLCTLGVNFVLASRLTILLNYPDLNDKNCARVRMRVTVYDYRRSF